MMKSVSYDIIGDIHGHADHLIMLLESMDYRLTDQGYYHNIRKVLFVGDYIDRGPKIRETLSIVKTMVDNGQAIALMGNHEYNAICYNTVGADGEYLRKHTVKNSHQHQATLDQFKSHEEDYHSYIEWFKTLALWYEDDSIRAVHATWDQSNIDKLSILLTDAKLTKQTLLASANEGTELFQLVEETLKGKEIEMPAGQYFLDKDGHKRHHIRIKWWLNPEKTSYRDISVIAMDDKLPESRVEISDSSYYGDDEKPVFFGHYWLKGKPELLSSNVCCLDYSVAKGGSLVCYRHIGEQELTNDNFHFIDDDLKSISRLKLSARLKTTP